MSRNEMYSSSEPATSRAVLVVDDVRLTREAVTELLQARGLQVTMSGSGHDAIARQLDVGRIQLVVCNATTVHLPRAVAAVRRIRDLPIVAMSVGERVSDVALCAELNVAGFVTADDSVDDLVELISTAKVGTPRCPAHAIPMLMKAVHVLASGSSETRLTAREREIAALLQEGLSNKQIASRLGITISTVKNHLQRIYEKLGVRGRSEVAALLNGRRGY